jgi:hypothetical protein
VPLERRQQERQLAGVREREAAEHPPKPGLGDELAQLDRAQRDLGDELR